MAEEHVQFDQLIPFFRQLPGYRLIGGWHTAKCPCHQDDRNSLILSGKGVLSCRTGCKFADLMRYFRSVGLVDQVKPPKNEPLEWKRVATYQSVDYTGTVVGVKHREEARRSDGSRVKQFFWEWHDHPMKDMPLFGWESIKGERVVLAEGEKSQQALVAAGIPAVTTVGGAGVDKMSPPVWEPLRDKDVIIWRDNDEPGRLFALAVARQLFGIARSVRIVVWADGGSKADAADYLALSLDPEEILRHRDISAEQASPDHIRVTVQTDIGPAMFDFEDIHQNGLEEVKCELTVTMLSSTGIDTPYNCRINLLSASARDQARRALELQFGKNVADPGGWTSVMSKAWAGMNGIRKNGATAKPIAIPSDDKRLEWLVDGLLPEDEDSILFAPEGAGKSLFYAVLAAAIATGHPFAGQYAVKQGGVLILDYERDEEAFAIRLSRILRGMGMDPAIIPELPIRYIHGNGVPFADQVTRVIREADAIDAVLVVVDSLGFAVAGELNDASSPMSFYRKRVGRTTLAIGQVPHGNDDKLFGGRFWMYAPHGLIWGMRRTAGNPTAMSVDLFPAKPHPELGMPEDISISYTFGEDRSIRAFTEKSKRHHLVDRIRGVLLMNPEGLRLWEIAEQINAVDAERDEVWRALNDYRGRHWESFEGEADRVQRWRLK